MIELNYINFNFTQNFKKFFGILIMSLLCLIIYFFNNHLHASQEEEDKLMKVTTSCTKNKRGDQSFSQSFYAIVTENTFQGSRYWVSKKTYPGDIGHVIYTGFKTKDRLIVKAKARYVKHGNQYSYTLKSEGNLSIQEHLMNGVTGIKEPGTPTRRKCTMKYVNANYAIEGVAIKNIKKLYYNVIKQTDSLEKKAENLRNENIKFNKQIASLKNEIIKEKKISLNLEKKIEDINKEKKIIENKLTLFRDKLESGEKKQKLAEEKLKELNK